MPNYRYKGNLAFLEFTAAESEEDIHKKVKYKVEKGKLVSVPVKCSHPDLELVKESGEMKIKKKKRKKGDN